MTITAWIIVGSARLALLILIVWDVVGPHADHTTRIVAFANVAIAVFAAATVLVAIFAYLASQGQLNVMQGQLDTMEADQRPWIKATIQLTALRFTEAGDAEITFNQNFKNIGKSPAQNIKERIGAVAVTESTAIRSIDEERTQCELAAKDSAEDVLPGLFLFPDEEAPEALIGGKGIGRAYVTASEFAKAWPNPKTLIFKLIGCIDYSFSSNGRHGQTGFAFIISRKVPNELGHETGFIPGKEAIPPEQIIFRPDPFSGGYVK